MAQLLTVSINLLWLLQQPHVLFSDPHISSLPCLPTYQQLERRSQSPLFLHWYPDPFLFHDLWWVEEWIFTPLRIIQSFEEEVFLGRSNVALGVVKV